VQQLVPTLSHSCRTCPSSSVLTARVIWFGECDLREITFYHRNIHLKLNLNKDD
jgi:hypothetical protein